MTIDDIDKERMYRLGHKLVAAIQEFGAAEYANKVNNHVADTEILITEVLITLVNVVGCVVRAVDCSDCRVQKSEATSDYLEAVLQDAVANPAEPDRSAHVH